MKRKTISSYHLRRLNWRALVQLGGHPCTSRDIDPLFFPTYPCICQPTTCYPNTKVRIDHNIALSCSKIIWTSICITSNATTSNQGPGECQSKLRTSHNLYNQFGFQGFNPNNVMFQVTNWLNSLFSCKKNGIQKRTNIILEI